MNWIRIASGIGRDPSVLMLAEALGVSTPLTTGCLVLVLAELPVVSRAGDLSGVSDAAIEAWAQWPGKRGKFATAFRAYLCTQEGVVRSWDKHNGAALRESDRRRNAGRDRRERDRRVPGTLPVRDGHADPTRDGHVTGVRNVTGRDELLTTTTKATTIGFAVCSGTGHVTGTVAVPPVPKRKRTVAEAAPKFPHFPTADRESAYATWTGTLGSVAFPRLVNAIGSLWPGPDATDRPSGPALLWALERYCRTVTSGASSPFASPEKAGACLVAIARLRETHRDPTLRVDAIDTIVHGRPT